ncbi:hypothetical protein [Ectobacillus panaciterrae]
MLHVSIIAMLIVVAPMYLITYQKVVSEVIGHKNKEFTLYILLD